MPVTVAAVESVVEVAAMAADLLWVCVGDLECDNDIPDALSELEGAVPNPSSSNLAPIPTAVVSLATLPSAGVLAGAGGYWMLGLDSTPTELGTVLEVSVRARALCAATDGADPLDLLDCLAGVAGNDVSFEAGSSAEVLGTHIAHCCSWTARLQCRRVCLPSS